MFLVDGIEILKNIVKDIRDRTSLDGEFHSLNGFKVEVVLMRDKLNRKGGSEEESETTGLHRSAV